MTLATLSTDDLRELREIVRLSPVHHADLSVILVAIKRELVHRAFSRGGPVYIHTMPRDDDERGYDD